jgi:hypothetical protein
MNQKLSDWASIAEIISAGAIVVSLIFVGTEIRRNTEAEYLLSYDRLSAEMTNWRMTLATNPETYAEYELFVEAMEAYWSESEIPTLSYHHMSGCGRAASADRHALVAEDWQFSIPMNVVFQYVNVTSTPCWAALKCLDHS